MFENDMFDVWLDNKSQEIILKLDKEKLSTEEMMILMLKAQTNHFAHLDQDLPSDRFMIWSFTTSLAIGAAVVAATH